MSHVDAVVVGAGAAGLAAAAALRADGRSVLLLEAADRIGGRAWTAHPAALGGRWFDLGATWLHAADRNPLVDLARAAGDALVDTDAQRVRRVMVDGRAATGAELDAYDAAQSRLEALAGVRLQQPGDTSLADAAAAADSDPWMATVLVWEGAIIAAADADVLSLRDWHANELEGPNLVPEGGVGAMIARRLGAAAGQATLNSPVQRIAWHGAGGVVVESVGGTVRAGACIVTVSTGVLASGSIRFDPPLPAAVQDAVAGLPMGLLTKLALRAAGSDRLGLPASCSLQRRVAPNEAAMFFNAWPQGADFLSGFVGGRAAWRLAGDARATEDFARTELRRTLGAEVDRALTRGAVVSDWGSDPLFRGAYAYARPGCAGLRARLAEPLADGRLILAGEATRTDGLAGTVGGAVLSGRDAARVASALLRGSRRG